RGAWATGLLRSSDRAAPRPGASLRTGRKIVAAPQIDGQIDDRIIHIKYLGTQSSTRPAGRRLPGLREAAGRVGVDISWRSPMVSDCQNHTLTFDKIAQT